MQADRNRVVGAERQLGAVGGGGQIQAPPEVLAGKLDEDARRMNDRRFDEDVAGLREKPAQRFIGRAHRGVTGAARRGRAGG